MVHTMISGVAKRCLISRLPLYATARWQWTVCGVSQFRGVDRSMTTTSLVSVIRPNCSVLTSLSRSSRVDSCSFAARDRPFCTCNVTWQKIKVTTRAKPKSSGSKAIVESREGPYAGLTAAEKVREAGKDASYSVVIIIGLAVTGAIFYVIGRELFSSQSSSGIYGDAFKLCKHSTRISDVFGEPLKGYGEMTRRGRRRHVSHVEWEDAGVKHMRMKFYIEGPRGKGTVSLEVKKGESGKYEYRYLFVEPDFHPRQPIILEDNR